MNILGWPDWEVIDTEEKDGNRRISAAPKYTPLGCNQCLGSIRSLVKFGVKEQLFLDLPSLGLRTGILVPRQRYRCKTCGATFLQLLNEMDERRGMTRRLHEMIRTRSFTQTFVSLAAEVGVTEGLIRQIFRERVTELEEAHSPELARVLGLDELHLLRRYRAVITNIERGTIVDMLADKKKATLERYFSRFDLPARSEVRVVTIDMTPTYRDVALAYFPNAVVVADKFHVVKTANDALDEVRKAVKSQLPEAKRRSLRRDRYILLSRPTDLTMRERIYLDTWLGTFPELNLAYSLKEGFFDIYEASSKQEALERLAEWKEHAQAKDLASVTKAFKPVVRMVTNWETEVFAYFDHRETNSKTERLNSSIRSVHRLGRGYSFEVLRAKMLFAEGVRVKVSPRYPKQWGRGAGARSDFSSYSRMSASDLGGPRPLDYGASIDRLVEMIERGEI